ncbi:MAG: hypothetical protein BRD23_06130 [Halobacteriales archaeon SW_9_67_25]|nr:MAG: hypothetical protein BRD23_06130 [Halobacteriales archaeon SW_9_67_25]
MTTDSGDELPEPAEPEKVPDWEDEYVDRVSDRLMFNYDLEKDHTVEGRHFTLYGEMQVHHEKHFIHPVLSFAHHDTFEHVFIRETDAVTVDRVESFVDVGHALAEEWIDADEEHYATEFTFTLLVEDIPDAVRSFVDGFRDRTMLKKGYYGHYEVHLVVVDPDGEDLVASERASLEEAFRVWEPLEEEKITWLDLLRRRLQI